MREAPKGQGASQLTRLIALKCRAHQFHAWATGVMLLVLAPSAPMLLVVVNRSGVKTVDYGSDSNSNE